MLLRMLIAGLMAGFFVFEASAAPCGPRAAVEATLANRYGEILTSQGVDSQGNLVRLYRAPSGSWTIAVLRPSGIMCGLAAGQGWQLVAPKPRDGESS